MYPKERISHQYGDDGELTQPISVGDTLNELRKPFASDATDVGGNAAIAARNLVVVCDVIYALAERLGEISQKHDFLAAVGIKHVFPYYIEELPKLLKYQLEVGHSGLSLERYDSEICSKVAGHKLPPSDDAKENSH